MLIGVLTISDSCYNGLSVDQSGLALKNAIKAGDLINGVVAVEDISPDEKDIIQSVLISWCDEKKLNLILTTGGTGLSPRDVTPEAVKEIIDREATGFNLRMVSESLKITPLAMVSRPTCGVRGSTLIITLPGSKKASIECLRFVAPAITHTVDLLTEQKDKIEDTHYKLQNMSLHVQPKVSKVVLTVSRRNRKSPYPKLTVEKAQYTVFKESYVMPLNKKRLVDAVGYVIGEDVIAQEDLPPFPASIKDGYAVKVSDGDGSRIVIGSSVAGIKPMIPDLFATVAEYMTKEGSQGTNFVKPDQPVTSEQITTEVTNGHCMRISTGAPVPPGADAVVQVEDTELISETADGKEELEINILKAPTLWQDIRKIGSDISSGSVILPKHSLISHAELGVLASAGVQSVLTYDRPTVAILSTGCELQDLKEHPLGQGKIYDSNRPVLESMLKEYANVYDGGIARDSPSAMLNAIEICLSKADILVTSGSVSMGERDLLRPVLECDFDAKIHFAQVFMKPGKPTTFATCTYKDRKKLIIGLPGNPVSAVVTANLYVIPLCKRLSGFSPTSCFNIEIIVKTAEDIKLDPRPEYQRARISSGLGADMPVAVTTGNQISSRLASMSGAQVLIKLPAAGDVKVLPTGSEVSALLL